MYLWNELSPLPLFLLLILWFVGGWLVAARTFRLQPHERGLVGLGLGLVLGTWLANWLARWMSADLAFWAAGGLLVLVGLALAWPLNRELISRDALQPTQWLLFALAAITLTLIGRGLGFFDDAQNLPHVSMMATGDVPPHFAFDPRIGYGYHYFLLLVAAQFVRLTQAGPWTALDLARGLTLALTLTYGGFVAYRLTHSKLAQTLSVVFMAFAGGARWIFLFLPLTLQHHLSSSIHLIGSGADSGPNFITAIYKFWNIEGNGPLKLPFLFGSGLDPSFSMFHNGWGTSAIMIALLLILLATLRQNWRSDVPIVILLASLALANEVTFAFLYLGLFFAILSWVLQKRSLHLPRSFWVWFTLFFIGGLFALVQGGMFTEIIHGWISRQVSGQSDTYFQVGFSLGAPAFLSAHLGWLSLLNPLQWVAILGETGLAVFAAPIVLKQLGPFSRDENWLEAAWVGSIIVSLLTVFIQYTGNAGPTAASRMEAHFLTVTKIYAIPLLWTWALAHGERVRSGLVVWGLATILSGFSLFGLQLAAMPNPVYATFLTHLDVQMFERHWNQLAPGTMVFDDSYPRAVTVLGRPIRSSLTMGAMLPAYAALHTDPNPHDLLAAGYDYLYVDLKYYRKYQTLIDQSCVKLLDRVDDKNGSKLVDSRFLFDLTSCR